MKNFVLIFLLVCNFAKADFSGQWIGQGSVKSTQGFFVLCEHLEINVEQFSSHIAFGKFRYVCGGYAINFNPPLLTLQNKNEILWKNQKVGSLSSSNANLLFPLVNEGSFAKYTVVKSGNVLRYKDEQISSEKTTTIEGVLFKTQK